MASNTHVMKVVSVPIQFIRHKEVVSHEVVTVNPNILRPHNNSYNGNWKKTLFKLNAIFLITLYFSKEISKNSTVIVKNAVDLSKML